VLSRMSDFLTKRTDIIRTHTSIVHPTAPGMNIRKHNQKIDNVPIELCFKSADSGR
jgi:hypothetical protein